MKIAYQTLFGLMLVTLMAAMVSQAQAGLIVTKESIHTESGHFRWTYGIHNPNGNTVRTGDSFTIYDFGAFMPGQPVTVPAGWSYSVQNTGFTPVGGLPNDDAGIPNITFTYSGTDLVGGIGLSNFALRSYSGQGNASELVSSVGYTGSQGSDVSTVSISTPTPVVPEPATLALMGIGIPLMGAVRWIRRRRENADETPTV